MRATWISTIYLHLLKTPCFCFPLSHGTLIIMDYMIYIKIFSFQPCLLLDVPYQIHIWARSPPFPPIGLWTFPSPWAHDPFFLLVSGFPLLNHVTSGCMSLRSLFFQLVSGFPLLKTRDFRFRLWRHPYIKTRLSSPSDPTLLLPLSVTF